MATHSSILAWRIPWTEEPDGLQSTGSQRVGHILVTKQKQLYGMYYKDDNSILLIVVNEFKYHHYIKLYINLYIYDYISIIMISTKASPSLFFLFVISLCIFGHLLLQINSLLFYKIPI